MKKIHLQMKQNNKVAFYSDRLELDIAVIFIYNLTRFNVIKNYKNNKREIKIFHAYC